MKYTLDLNMCRDEQLKILLNQDNEIIITDDFLVEIFKAENPLSMFLKNTSIIKQFPNKIYVTYDRGQLVRMELTKMSPLNINDLIDLESTSSFRNWLLNENEFHKIIPHAKMEAKKRIDHQKNFVDNHLLKTTQKLRKLLKSDNSRHQYTSDRAKLLHDIRETSITAMEKFFESNNITNIESFKLSNSIIYAQTYILIWRVSHWALKNGIDSISPKKLINDGFDIKYILISTFFDDLLTKEIWLKECRLDTINSLATSPVGSC